MWDNQSSNRANAPVGSPLSEETAPASPPQDDDAGLLTLEEQFDELVGELLATQPTVVELATRVHQQSLSHDSEVAGIDADTRTKRAEAILARLYPIEQAIMQTRARTIAGLGVKARHAAYVMSHYWEEPIDQIDWEAQTIRLLDRAPRCGVADGRSPPIVRRVGRHQLATAGKPTMGSSLKGAMVSSVM